MAQRRIAQLRRIADIEELQPWTVLQHAFKPLVCDRSVSISHSSQANTQFGAKPENRSNFAAVEAPRHSLKEHN